MRIYRLPKAWFSCEMFPSFDAMKFIILLAFGHSKGNQPRHDVKEFKQNRFRRLGLDWIPGWRLAGWRPPLWTGSPLSSCRSAYIRSRFKAPVDYQSSGVLPLDCNAIMSKTVHHNKTLRNLAAFIIWFSNCSDRAIAQERPS